MYSTYSEYTLLHFLPHTQLVMHFIEAFAHLHFLHFCNPQKRVLMKVSNSFLLTCVDSHKGPLLPLLFPIPMASDQVGQSYLSALSINNQLDSMLALCDELMLVD